LTIVLHGPEVSKGVIRADGIFWTKTMSNMEWLVRCEERKVEFLNFKTQSEPFKSGR